MRNQTCVVQASAVLWGLVKAGWGVLVQEKCPGSWLALARARAAGRKFCKYRMQTLSL